MRLIAVLLLLALLSSVLPSRAVLAEGEKAGAFDYYVLSLSWSPNWCALAGDARGAPQCARAAGFGWVLHGLWPQYDRGWPSYCRTSARDPSRRQTAAMADIMGDSGSAWHQWKKHGRCSGLSASAYFEAARRAFEAIRRPAALRNLHGRVRIAASVVEQAFLRENPGLSAQGLSVTCKSGAIQEVRICLTRGLEPRACGEGLRDDCSLTDAILEPVR